MARYSSDSDSDRSGKYRKKHYRRSRSSSSDSSDSSSYRKSSSKHSKTRRRHRSRSRSKGRDNQRTFTNYRPSPGSSKDKDRRRYKPRRSKSNSPDKNKKRTRSVSREKSTSRSSSSHISDKPTNALIKDEFSIEPRIKESILEEINANGFAPKQFTSSNQSKDRKVSGKNIVIDITADTIQMPTAPNLPSASESIFHSSILMDQEARFDKWVKKLYNLRQKAMTDMSNAS